MLAPTPPGGYDANQGQFPIREATPIDDGSYGPDPVSMHPFRRKTYWLSLITVNFCSLVSFSCIASADNYAVSTPLGFAVGSGILSWLSSGFFFLMSYWSPQHQCSINQTGSHIGSKPHRMTLAARLFFCIFAYSGAISSASVSADLHDIYSMDDKSNNEYNSFVDKIRAGCAFACEDISTAHIYAPCVHEC